MADGLDCGGCDFGDCGGCDCDCGDCGCGNCDCCNDSPNVQSGQSDDSCDCDCCGCGKTFADAFSSWSCAYCVVEGCDCCCDTRGHQYDRSRERRREEEFDDPANMQVGTEDTPIVKQAGWGDQQTLVAAQVDEVDKVPNGSWNADDSAGKTTVQNQPILQPLTDDSNLH